MGPPGRHSERRQQPNSARLMVHFIVSHYGQAAFGRGGLTPYRSDVRKEEVANFTLTSIAEAVGGEQNLMIIGSIRSCGSGRMSFQPAGSR